jgi:hypothetical protein
VFVNQVHVLLKDLVSALEFIGMVALGILLHVFGESSLVTGFRG